MRYATEEQRARHREVQRRYREKNRAKINAGKRGWRSRLTAEQYAAVRKREALCKFLWRSAHRTQTPVGPTLRQQLMGDDLYVAVHKLVPHHLPEFVRDDIISDLCLCVLSGDFPIEDIGKHLKVVTARHRGLTSKFGALSLDEVIGEDGYTRGHAMGMC